MSKSEEGGPAAKSLREAGRLEHYFDTRSRLNLNACVVVTAQYSSITGASLDKATIFAALEEVIGNEAALVARLPPSSSDLPWIRLPSVDLNKVVTFVEQDSDTLHVLLEEYFARPLEFAEDMPLWRLLVLRDGTLIFAYDHAMADGQSGLAFHVALLGALNGLPATVAEHSGIVAAPQDTALAPAMEDAVDVSVPFMVIIREIIKAFFPFFYKRKLARAWTGNPVVKPLTLATTVRILKCSPAETARLLALARAHKTTLTCTLHTLALRVVSPLVYAQPANGAAYTTIPTFIVMSSRRFTGAPPSVMCNHIGNVAEHHALFREDPPAFAWDAAAALVALLKRGAPHSMHSVGMLKYLHGNYEGYLLGRLGGKRAAGLELSNLGAFPQPTQAGGDSVGPWKIGQMLFSQADATVGAALKLNVAGGGDGGLGVTVTWGKGAVDHELAEGFVKGFDEGLRALVA
ncbi:alcohol acetyltransferase [Daedaleopsis nitida]|nr:alcohol acetyltransferase [Daedaleopsis nitida]